jgi:hypothetical protein
MTHKLKGTRDITLDEVLLRYLAVGEKPSDPREVARVMRASTFLDLESDGKLLIKLEGQPDRSIPPMKRRMGII